MLNKIFLISLFSLSLNLHASGRSCHQPESSPPYTNAELASTLGITDIKDLSDPLKAYEDHLNQYGPYEKARIGATRFMLKTYPELIKHGSEFFHGSRSSSLMAFLESTPRFQGLIPTGILLKNGRVPLSGELNNGIAHPEGVNREHLSVTDLLHALDSVGYAKDINKSPWTPESAKEIIEQLSSYKKSSPMDRDRHEILIGLEKKRLERWENLTALEKHLVQANFPVLYGIKLLPGREAEEIESRYGPTEFKILSGVRFNDIRVIFVPSSEIEFTRNLIKSANLSIAVESFDPIVEKAVPFTEYFRTYLKNF